MPTSLATLFSRFLINLQTTYQRIYIQFVLCTHRGCEEHLFVLFQGPPRSSLAPRFAVRKCQIIIFSVSHGARPAQIRIINRRKKAIIIIVRVVCLFLALSGWRKGSPSLIDWAFQSNRAFYDVFFLRAAPFHSPPLPPYSLIQSRFYDFMQPL